MTRPIAAAAVAALFAASAQAEPPAKQGKASAALVMCKGINECKNKGKCTGPDSDKNTCKGKGALPVTAADCKAKGGVVAK